jgi:hypothetical protein
MSFHRHACGQDILPVPQHIDPRQDASWIDVPARIEVTEFLLRRANEALPALRQGTFSGAAALCRFPECPPRKAVPA